MMPRVAAPSEHLGGFCICSVQISTLPATVCAGEAQFLMQSKADSEKKQLHEFLFSPLYFAFSLYKTALIYPMWGNGGDLFFKEFASSAACLTIKTSQHPNTVLLSMEFRGHCG